MHAHFKNDFEVNVQTFSNPKPDIGIEDVSSPKFESEFSAQLLKSTKFLRLSHSIDYTLNLEDGF